MPSNPIPFEALADTDLHVGQVYLGGTAKHVGADALAKLLPCGNSGGFRKVKCRGFRGAVVLYTTLNDVDWPDHLDEVTGRFTYYGDKRGIGGLTDTFKGGNQLLEEVFALRHGSSKERARVPAFLVFANDHEAGGRAVRFLGLAVPGRASLSEAEDLVAVWKLGKDGRFQNYRATFTMLKTGTVSRDWVRQITAGDHLGTACPPEFRSWVDSGRYEAAISDPVKVHRTKLEQLPKTELDWRLVKTIYDYFKDGQAFEPCAAQIASWALPGLQVEHITRGSVDGGLDAVGHLPLGVEPDYLKLSVLIEAKRFKLGEPMDYKACSGVGVKGTSRLISRLRRRDVGILVTTSFVGRQPYKEIREDGHHVLIVAAVDIAGLLKKNNLTSVERVQGWLKSNFAARRS